MRSFVPLYVSLDAVRVRWTGYVARITGEKSYKVLVRKAVVKMPL